MNSVLSADLIILQEILSTRLNLTICNIKIEKESKGYSACTFEINGLKVLYREAKTTSTKIG
jgi:MepB protein